MRIFVMDKYTGLCLCLLCALLIAVPVLWYQTEPTSASASAVPVCAAETSEPILALTFNLSGDGSDIPALLASLSDTQCPATFFASADWASMHTEQIRRISDAGHTVAPLADAPQKADAKTWLSSINQAEQVISDITGIASGFSRCAENTNTSSFAEACRQSGRIPVAWSVDSLDWRNFSAEQITFRLKDHMEKGAILRFQTGTQATNKISEIVTAIRSAGYTPVPLQTLFPAPVSENFS